MTLISFATYGADRIEFITDTVSYTKRVENLGRCTKQLSLPHIDTVILTQGNSYFGVAAKTMALTASANVATFDDLVDHAPELMTLVHADCMKTGPTPHDDQSIVFLLGWSNRDGKWRAYELAADNEFAAVNIAGLYVLPSPWQIRPSKTEHARFEEFMSDSKDDPKLGKLADWWKARPAQPAPRTTTEWVDLAEMVRRQRTLDHFYQTIVAGDVFHTTLRRGSIETRRIHTFNDTGDEFKQMIQGTSHPIGLTLPCLCESGKPYGECCVMRYQDCDCGSGEAFAQCCGKTEPAACV